MKHQPIIRQRFTLIELLVVVAIIAILAAMLLPALNKARDQSLKISCVNQLKQVNTAVQFYADDNHDMLPCAMKWDYATYESTPDVNTTQYAVNRMSNYFKQLGAWEWKRYAGPSVDGWYSSKLLNCPKHAGMPKLGFFSKNHISDYQFNYRYSHAKLGGQMRQNYHNGSDTAAWAFKGPLGASDVFTFRDYAFGAQTTYPQVGRHGNQGNVAYADGHVETVNRLRQIMNNGTDLNYLY